MALIRTNGESTQSATLTHDAGSLTSRTVPYTKSLTGEFTEGYLYVAVSTPTYVSGTIGSDALTFTGASPCVAHISGNYTDPTITINGQADFGTASVWLDII